MAIAYDNVSHSTSAVANNFSWTHTPTGTPRGALVFIAQNASGSDDVTGVTYGGTAMTRVGRSLHATGETGAVYVYFLGASIPTGAQTVAVTAGTSLKDGHCVTVTAATNTYVLASDFTISSDSLANPSVTLSLQGRNAFCAIVGHSGQQTVGGITPLTSWTSRDEYDWGSQTSLVYTYDTIGSSNVTAGWTQTADDAVMGAVAIRETQTLTLDATTAQTFSMTGTAAGVLWNRRMNATTAQTFSMTGTAAATLYNRVLNATNAQTFSMSGTAAPLLHNRVLNATDPQTFTLDGTAAGLFRGYVVGAGAGQFDMTGIAASLLYNKVVTAGSGTFTYSGTDVQLIYSGAGGAMLPEYMYTLAPLRGDLGGLEHG